MLLTHYRLYLLIKLALIYLLANLVIIEGSTKDQYVGCFCDNSSQLLQWEDTLNGSSMTIELCIGRCRTGGGKTYAKLQNGTVCQCGDDYGQQTLDRACNLTCPGNQSEYCGGVINASLTTYALYTVCPIGNYSTQCDRVCHCKRQVPCDRATGKCPNGCDRNFTGSTCNTTTTSARYIGCFKDNSTDNSYRALPNRVHDYNQEYRRITINVCIGWCQENFSTFAGAQFGSECYCGDSYDKYGQLNESACSTNCFANSGEVCGGSKANSVYSVCPAGNYGNGCSQRCNCFNDGRCLYLNGTCLSRLCKPGWTGISCNSRDCATVNGDCLPNESCLSVDLKFTNYNVCRCSDGFQRDEIWQNCTDIDECATTPSVCGKDAINCTNTAGGYECHCKNDQTTYKEKCVSDIDECATTPSVCGKDTINCTNTVGGYECHCKNGQTTYKEKCISASETKSEKTSMIIGAVVGSVCGLLVILAIIATVFCYRRQQLEAPPISKTADAEDSVANERPMTPMANQIQQKDGTYETPMDPMPWRDYETLRENRNQIDSCYTALDQFKNQ